MSRAAMEIKKLRTEKGETQQQLGIAIGVSTMAVSKYESGKMIPNDDNKIKIARHFDRSVEDIFFRYN